MVNLITINAEGHKVASRITDREQYLAARNTAANISNFLQARAGDKNAKCRLVQFNYNDQLPDGLLAGCHTAASTFCHDIDCHDQQLCSHTADTILEMKQQLGLLELSVSPNWGLHAVLRRQMGMTILENQIRIAMLTHTEMDLNAHDQQRILFTGPTDTSLLFLDEAIFDETLTVEQGQQEYQRMKEREERGEEQLPANFRKGEKHYRPWETTQQQQTPPATEATQTTPATEATAPEPPSPMIFGHPAEDYIHLTYPDGAPRGQRHNTMLRLANDLIILLDNNEQQVKQTLMQVQWVRDVVRERGQKELDNVIDSAQKLLKKRESDTFYPVRPSREMQAAIEALTHRKYKQLTTTCQQTDSQDDTAAQMEMLLRMGRQIKKLMPHFPLLQLACHQHKLQNYPAVLFVTAGFCTPLLTRCWYSFYPSPGKKCRINSLVMLIGRFGGLKGFAVTLYDLLMAPIKQADQAQIQALNQWNKEREKNNGARQSSDTRPAHIYRCLPAETSAAAIREAEFNAKETIDNEEWPLHTFIFDSELNNTLEQMKKSHMDAFKTLWLKSFHNEWGGSLLKTSSSPVGEFRIHFNAVYTGTFDAFAKIATEATYSSGIASRFACTLMGPSNYEMMEYMERTPEDQLTEEQIREWAYKLDAAKGEIPTQDISKALYTWTARKMDEAREEQSEVLEDLCKRPAWVGINLALPFIVARHWAEMVKDQDGKYRCGAAFHMDKHDIHLAQLIAQMQYDFQQYFFYELGRKVHDKHNDSSFGRKLQSRTALSFKRLPEVFTSSDLKREYGYDNSNSVNSCLKRLQDDGRIQKIRSGENKGKYRKLT